MILLSCEYMFYCLDTPWINEMNNFNILSEYDDSAKTHALIAYILMVIGLFTGIFWLIGAIWALVKKPDAEQSIFYDHYKNIISMFWWVLGLSIIGFIFIFVFLGYLILFGVWVWSIYKLIKGLSKLSSNKSYES